MYVKYDAQMIFLAHPRTASRATRYVLLSRGFMLESGHHAGLQEHPGEGWTVFTTIRNHFDAWVSWWFRIGKRGPLDAAFVAEFVKQKPHFWPLADQMWGLHSHVADLLLRYETLEADLSDLLGDTLRLPVVNDGKRNGTPYRNIMMESARAYIEERFGAEMERQGYSW